MKIHRHSRTVRIQQKKTPTILDRRQYKDNAFLLADTLLPSSDAIEAYNSCKSFVEAARAICLIADPPPARLSQATLDLLRQRQSLRSDPNRIAYVISCKAARIATEKDIRRYKETQLKKAIEQGRNMRKAKQRTYHTRKRMDFRDASGGYSQAHTTNVVQTFYNELYRPAVIFPMHPLRNHDDIVPKFITSEVRSVLDSLSTSKAPGPDGVTPEQLYLARNQLSPVIASLLNHLLAGQPIPPPLIQSTIILLHKKGSTEKIENFRPICLLPSIYKAMTKTVLKRVESCLEDAERPTQAGFRPGYSMLDHAHSVKQLFEKIVEHKIPSYVAVIDFAKAFDSIEWPALWSALSTQGVHQDLQ